MLIGHAHLIAGGEEMLPSVLEVLETEGITVQGNPDIYIRSYRHFGVDDARELGERAQSKALGARRVFVITASAMTTEAQNSLLKTLEEPSANTLFFLIVPAPEMLLPTLRSRAQTQAFSFKKKIEMVSADDFRKAMPERRIEMLKPLLEKDEDDRRDIGPVIAFLSSLERALARSPQKSRQGIDAVYRARKYAGDKGSLIKPLLEQVALLVQ